MESMEKYIKSIAKSLEIIASGISESNNLEKEEMKRELEKEKKEKDDIIETANEIIDFLEKQNINIPKDTEDKLISSLSD